MCLQCLLRYTLNLSLDYIVMKAFYQCVVVVTRPFDAKKQTNETGGWDWVRPDFCSSKCSTLKLP